MPHDTDDEPTTQDAMQAGYGGLRNPQQPKPAKAPPTTIDDDRFNDRESRTATLTLRRDEAIQRGDTSEARVWEELLRARRLRHRPTPLICTMPWKWQQALDKRTDTLADLLAAQGRRTPPDLREQLHACACDVAEDDDLSDYSQALERIELD